jgi:hypothetical protein
MTVADILPWIPVIIGFIAATPGMIALIFQVRRYMAEPTEIHANAAKEYMEAAQGEAEYAQTLQKRLKDQQIEIDDLKAQLILCKKEKQNDSI